VATWAEREGATTERQARRFYYRKGWQWLAEHPGKWACLWLTKAALTWNHEEIPSSTDLRPIRQLTAVMRLPWIGFGVVGPLALCGIVICGKRRRFRPFLVVIVVHTLALTVFVTSGRYRLGMMPAVIVFAAVAAERFASCLNDRRNINWKPFTAILAIGTVLAWLPIAPRLAEERSEANMILAECAWLCGNVDAAERMVDQVLDHDGDNVAALHLKGVLLTDRKQYSEALAFLKRATALDLDNADVHVDLATAYSVMGKTTDAETELDAALQLAPHSAKALCNLGLLFERQQRFDEACKHYLQAIDEDPAMVSPRLNYALLMHRAGKYGVAEQHYRTVLRLAPGKVPAWNGLAALMADTGRLQQAVNCFNRSLTLQPDQSDVRDVCSQVVSAIENNPSATE